MSALGVGAQAIQCTNALKTRTKTKLKIKKTKTPKIWTQKKEKARNFLSRTIGPFQAVIEDSLTSLAHTPIKLQALDDSLSSYPDTETAAFLLNGFKNGFKIPYEGPRHDRHSKNHGSAFMQPDLINERLQDEINLGRVAGPFDSPPLENLLISPIGLVPKSTPGQFRLIFDLSYPHGSSVNSGISKEYSTVAYTHFDEITKMVQREGQGSYLFKVDIKSAFRLLPIHPDNFSLLGMEFQGKYYVDKCLPFGLSVSCALFEKFSSFLEWHIKDTTKSDELIHYLDDFCGCNSQHLKAKSILEQTLNAFDTFGVPVADDKVEGPSTRIKFLGLEVDTEKMLVQLPMDKLNDLKACIDEVLSYKSKKITLKKLQSLIGKLNFACRAIVPGRAFCRRLIDATIGATRPFHRIRVTKGMVEDLLIWKSFLDNHNGASMMISELGESHLELFTDAAGGIGFGAYFDGHWTNGRWPENLIEVNNIALKELFPIVLSLFMWGDEFKNQKVVFFCDNSAVVIMINKQSSKDKQCMHLLRILVSICLKKNVVFKAIKVSQELIT